MAFPKLKLFSSINSPPRSHLVSKLQQENFRAIADVTSHFPKSETLVILE